MRLRLTSTRARTRRENHVHTISTNVLQIQTPMLEYPSTTQALSLHVRLLGLRRGLEWRRLLKAIRTPPATWLQVDLSTVHQACLAVTYCIGKSDTFYNALHFHNVTSRNTLGILIWFCCCNRCCASVAFVLLNDSATVVKWLPPEYHAGAVCFHERYANIKTSSS